MELQQDNFQLELVPVNLPIWRELLTGIDWLALRYAPVYYGLGVPRGDRSAVILVPGFLATDTYLMEMSFWLCRMGYKPYLSKIGRNADCLNALVEKLYVTVEKAYRETGNRKVHLIGHSLGGVLSRAVATRYPHMVESVITLASPFRGISSHPIVLQASKVVKQRIEVVRDSKEDFPHCFTGACSCPTAESLRNNLPGGVMQTAIYTKTDGIVDWKVCVTSDPTANFEVTGTHVGLAFNPFVYRLLAQRLHQATQKAEANRTMLRSA
ncbi:MAG TPA: alpha/beta fold hydrolase [Chloroflexia bacterium]|nr:alpha/beta fold hydrolase [Chloroflexia bacterium]